MNQPFHSDSPQGISSGTAPSAGGGLPVSAALRILMGIGFCAVGLIKGVLILTSENGSGIGILLDGVGFFLLAGTGITMLMDRFYSLYLLLLWAALGIAGSFITQGELSLQLPALFARIMVGLVALVAIGQRGARTPG